MSTEARRRTLAARLVLIPWLCFWGLLLLEAALQVGALGLRWTGREQPTRFTTGDFRILCLGDSNTYGLHLERDQAYPSQLERLWNESAREPRIEVINMGFPGTNTSRLRRELPRMLETFAPDLVIAMIGVNDYWTVPVPVDDAEQPGALERMARRSRVYQVFRMLGRAFAETDLEVILDPERIPSERAEHRARFGGEEFSMGFEAATGGDRAPVNVTEGIMALAGIAESNGTPLVIMSYPSRFRLLYPRANMAIRRAATHTGVPLIDLAAVFEPLCPEESCPSLIFEDQHPNERGYAVVADTIAARLPEIFPETLGQGTSTGSASGPSDR